MYEMELVGHDFFLFVDAESGRPSVVYRRRGWSYGVIRLDVVAGDRSTSPCSGRPEPAATGAQRRPGSDVGLGRTPPGRDPPSWPLVARPTVGARLAGSLGAGDTDPARPTDPTRRVAAAAAAARPADGPGGARRSDSA